MLMTMAGFEACGNIHKVLVMSTSWLGDAVLTAPTIQGLRSIFPQAHVAVFARDAVARIFEALPCVDEIIPHARQSGPRRLLSALAAARGLRRRAFDAAFVFSRSFEPAFICRLAGIPLRVGFNVPGRNVLLTHCLPRDAEILGRHQVHYYRRLLDAPGSARTPECPHLTVPETERAWARDFLRGQQLEPGRTLVGLSPGSTYGDAKQWLPERFVQLARRLVDHHACRLVVLGDEGTRLLARRIHDALGRNVLDASGRTSVVQLAALLECCDLLVTNDSGPMHVAGAVGTPVVAVFGPTDPGETAPLGRNAVMVTASVPCSPCLKRTCPEGHQRCMRAVTVDDVERAVARTLADAGRRRPANL